MLVAPRGIYMLRHLRNDFEHLTGARNSNQVFKRSSRERNYEATFRNVTRAAPWSPALPESDLLDHNDHEHSGRSTKNDSSR